MIQGDPGPMGPVGRPGPPGHIVSKERLFMLVEYKLPNNNYRPYNYFHLAFQGPSGTPGQAGSPGLPGVVRT